LPELIPDFAAIRPRFTKIGKPALGKEYAVLINEGFPRGRLGHIAYANHFCALHNFS
jgi:hypothetical protein